MFLFHHVLWNASFKHGEGKKENGTLLLLFSVSTETLVTLDDFLDGRGVVQCAEVTQLVCLLLHHTPQNPTHDLP